MIWVRRLSACLPFLAFAPMASAARDITFNKDVLPILQNHCQECHRAGEIGKMPLMTYQQTRPWAAAIKESILLKKMPPWFADPHFGKFSNDRSLSKDELDTLTAWADGGAQEGAAKDAPPPRKFLEGWNIPTPDLVIQMPTPFSVPASGEVEYQYIVLPTNFKQDQWIRMAETRPTDRSVVHHMVVFVRDPESPWLRGEAQPGVAFVPPKTGRRNDLGGGGNEILTVYTPGMVPDAWKPNQAKLIKAGSDLVLQVHYTTNGKAAKDQTKIGMVLAKEPPTERILSLAVSNARFVIPPDDPNYEVQARMRLINPAKIISFFPHMHLRGKDFEYRAVFPNGETQTLLRVPKYEFNWQLAYKPAEEIALPPGTRLECTAHYDNSVNNPANPNPKAEVRFGEQSWEEMMVGFLDLAISDLTMDSRKFMTPPRPVNGGN
ncbi:conserved exported hypothetical protein [Candidatus Sulfopaludibacter sp. SbA3]|nr:conserved exported hypothetical protein [Candidatus Sulfopaludibacter sp. SbA3]